MCLDLDKPYKRVAFLTDPHHPYQDQHALDAAWEYLQDWRPDLLVLGGDHCDCYSVSDYDQDPGREEKLVDELASLKPYWDGAASLRCDVAVLEGNHDERIQRRKARAGLHGLPGIDLPSLSGMPKHFGWHPSQSHLRVGGPHWGLLFLHGDIRGRGTNSSNPAAAMLRKLRCSSMSGHIHRFDMAVSSTYDGTPLEAYTVGHMSDHHKAAQFITAPDWHKGLATIEFDHKAEWFGVQLLRFVRGRIRAGGRTYGN